MTCRSILTVAFSLILCTLAWAGPLPKELRIADTKGIPPEILKQMDPDIVSGKRPTVEMLKQDDIFGLRDKPKRDADFVRFDFDAGQLSGAQRKVLDQWLRDSSSRVLLLDADIWNFRELLGVDRAAFTFTPMQYDKSQSPSRWGSSTLRAEHAICTDVQKCTARGFRCAINERYTALFLFGILENSLVEGKSAMAATEPRDELLFIPQEDHTLIEEGGLVRFLNRGNEKMPPLSLVGAISIGKSRAFFLNTLEGPDRDRLLLNYWHWTLDLKVPGAVDSTAIRGGGGPKVILDAVRLKNGDTVSGRVLNESFTIKTSYATLTFKRGEVDTITIEGGGNNADEVRLVVGDRVSGVLQDAKVRVRLSGGNTTEVEKDKIKDVQICGSDAAPAGSDGK
ncbi:MAG: hypothetical protein FJZ01_28395 [Candidatus Sericytochromatia bacterium]|nr:hypothetical protein [Candidatus Tanganyikabacteria bacterium]